MHPNCGEAEPVRSIFHKSDACKSHAGTCDLARLVRNRCRKMQGHPFHRRIILEMPHQSMGDGRSKSFSAGTKGAQDFAHNSGTNLVGRGYGSFVLCTEVFRRISHDSRWRTLRNRIRLTSKMEIFRRKQLNIVETLEDAFRDFSAQIFALRLIASGVGDKDVHKDAKGSQVVTVENLISASPDAPSPVSTLSVSSAVPPVSAPREPSSGSSLHPVYEGALAHEAGAEHEGGAPVRATSHRDDVALLRNEVCPVP
jgi:hypothetical protein